MSERYTRLGALLVCALFLILTFAVVAISKTQVANTVIFPANQQKQVAGQKI